MVDDPKFQTPSGKSHTDQLPAGSRSDMSTGFTATPTRQKTASPQRVLRKATIGSVPPEVASARPAPIQTASHTLPSLPIYNDSASRSVLSRVPDILLQKKVGLVVGALLGLGFGGLLLMLMLGGGKNNQGPTPTAQMKVASHTNQASLNPSPSKTISQGFFKVKNSPPKASNLLRNTPIYDTKMLKTMILNAKTHQLALTSQEHVSQASQEITYKQALSYSHFCNLAYVLTYLSEDLNQNQLAPRKFAAQLLFEDLLNSPHTPATIDVCYKKRQAYPDRRHGGIFFTGKLLSLFTEGTVVSCKVKLKDSSIQTVLTKRNAIFNLEIGSSICVVGSLLQDPQTNVIGYTGFEEECVWGGYLFTVHDSKNPRKNNADVIEKFNSTEEMLDFLPKELDISSDLLK